jgi:hypothetical protein
MPKVRFLGVVFPSRGLQIHNLHSLGFRYASGLTADLQVEVRDSKITVDCELNRYDPSEFEMLHLHVFHIVRAFVDLVAFCSGNGYTTVLQDFIDPDGASLRIQAQDPSLANICTITPTDLFSLIADFEVSEILHTLTSTLQQPYLWPVNCARAIEAMARLVVPNEQNPKRRWKEFRAALRISEPYLQLISQVSTEPRHGSLQELLRPSPNYYHVRQRAWTVMNRFLEFRKRGGVDVLPASEFPEI